MIAHAIANKVLFGTHPLASPLQRGMQRLLSGPRAVTFEFKKGPAAGCKFSCLTSHKYFFVREDFEHELLQPIENLVRRDSVVYDIGAHFGFWAIVLSRLCPDGKVFAFEPSPENRERLHRNIAINSINNIEVVPLAASDRIGVAHMSNNGSMSKLGEGRLRVGTTTLDEFCKINPAPDMMLVDVEGHAGEVLRGGSSLFARRFVPMICEVHSRPEQTALLECCKASQVTRLDNPHHFPYRIIVNAEEQQAR